MKSLPIAIALCLVCACGGPAQPAAAPPTGDPQNPVPPPGSDPSAIPNSDPNVSPPNPPGNNLKPSAPSSSLDVLPDGSNFIAAPRAPGRAIPSRNNVLGAPALPVSSVVPEGNLLFVSSEDMGDFRLTAQVRQTLMRDPELTITAKNIQIRVVDGQVILNGIVNSQSERAAIMAGARRVAGADHVTGLLAVR
jgi:BON domain